MMSFSARNVWSSLIAHVQRRCPLKGAKRSQSFIHSTYLIKQVLETVNKFTKDRKEHIESIDNEIKQVKEKITNVKQVWISYLESL